MHPNRSFQFEVLFLCVSGQVSVEAAEDDCDSMNCHFWSGRFFLHFKKRGQCCMKGEKVSTPLDKDGRDSRA